MGGGFLLRHPQDTTKRPDSPLPMATILNRRHTRHDFLAKRTVPSAQYPAVLRELRIALPQHGQV